MLPLDCLLTPLPSPPSWDPLNCLETDLEASGPSPRDSSGRRPKAAAQKSLDRGFQKLLERVSRQFRGSQERGEGRGVNRQSRGRVQNVAVGPGRTRSQLEVARGVTGPRSHGRPSPRSLADPRETLPEILWNLPNHEGQAPVN